MSEAAEERRIQETTVDGMAVTKVGRGQYECASQSDPERLPYHVDILANEGLGECDCWDFKSRRLPRWIRMRALYDSFRCKHLRRVRNHVLDQILSTYVHKERGK